jgi:hypothetical protein
LEAAVAAARQVFHAAGAVEGVHKAMGIMKQQVTGTTVMPGAFCALRFLFQ